MVRRIVRGLDIPVAGAPEQVIDEGRSVGSVALLGGDYPGLRPVLRVAEGDRVRLGQTLFSDRRHPRIRFTAPATGTVTAINRGARRALESVVLRREDDDDAGETFPARPAGRLDDLRREEAREILLHSGMWTALRARPFGGVADPETEPGAIFVTAMDTNPLAAEAAVVIAGAQDDFVAGIRAAARLADAPLYVCTGVNTKLPELDVPGVAVEAFSGPHPAGLVGTHIHLLHPPPAGGAVWYLGYQDVIAIGRLFTTGCLVPQRVIALGGPAVLAPRLIRSRMGAAIDDLVNGELAEGPVRVISGPLLSGYHAAGNRAWLGRYHTQICAIPDGVGEAGTRFSYFRPGGGAGRRRPSPLGTARNGRETALLPVSALERVTPLSMPVTVLLRALLSGDAALAADLGCQELEEEDLAPCSFVCPGKHDYGAALRAALNEIASGA